MCYQHVDALRYRPRPYIFAAGVLKCPVPMTWRARAAVDSKAATVGAGDSCLVVLQVDDIPPVDRLSLSSCIPSTSPPVTTRIQQQIVVAGNDDFDWVRLGTQPVYCRL
jgi:hypothetical protein